MKKQVLPFVFSFLFNSCIMIQAQDPWDKDSTLFFSSMSPDRIDTLDKNTYYISCWRNDMNYQKLLKDTQSLSSCLNFNSRWKRLAHRSNYHFKYFISDEYNSLVLYDTLNSLFDTMQESFRNIKISMELSFLLSPFSGDEFGDACGEGGAESMNNFLFDAFIPSIDSGNLWILMCARNPVTRTNAVIYYMRNREMPFHNRALIEHLIERLKRHPFTVNYCSGCTVHRRMYPSEIIEEYDRR